MTLSSLPYHLSLSLLYNAFLCSALLCTALFYPIQLFSVLLHSSLLCSYIFTKQNSPSFSLLPMTKALVPRDEGWMRKVLKLAKQSGPLGIIVLVPGYHNLFVLQFLECLSDFIICLNLRRGGGWIGNPNGVKRCGILSGGWALPHSFRFHRCIRAVRSIAFAQK